MIATPLPRFFPAQKTLVVLLVIIVWLGGVWFFSRHNDFPIYYHPDEESKARQILSGELNFHHPLLLLDTASLLLRLSGQPPTTENAVFAGRWASAIFTSAAVVLLAVLAGRRAGWPGALLALLLVPLHPLIYELAHYCKEDPALLLGLSLGLLALDVFLTTPTVKTAAFLGAAAGLAVSGKYLGVVLLLVTLPLLLWRCRENRGQAVGAYFGAFLTVVLLINLPYLLHPAALQKGLSYELQAASLGGAKGLSREVPHGKYLGILADNVGWPLWLGMAAFLAGNLFSRRNDGRQRKISDLVLLLFPLAYALLLSFSPKTASRYFLAVSPLLILAGSIGLAWLAEAAGRLPRSGRWMVFPGLGFLAFWVQIELIAPSYRGLQTDSRREMARWMATHLPAGSVVLAESRIHLTKAPTWPDAASTRAMQITETPFLPDLGTLESLEARQVRYVAVIRTSFGGFMDKKRKPVKSLEDQHERRSRFYEELFAKGTLLQKTGGTGVGILNPEVRLYRLW